jgi:chemotaxis methyl-accepting protein methylase
MELPQYPRWEVLDERRLEQYALSCDLVLGRLRLWCAAAATGEEPWTIALTVHQAIPDLAQWDAAILATDISRASLRDIKSFCSANGGSS